MANLKDIKKRIGSLKSTSQITKAMKMVSAAKLRKAQESIIAARPYAEKMHEVLGRLAAGVDTSSNPLLERRVSKRVGLVLFTSDRGLCGGFNANLIKKAESFAAEHGADKEISMTFFGRKGRDYFRRRGEDTARFYHAPVGGAGYDMALDIAAAVTDSYRKGEVDEVHVIYGRFQSAITQVPTVERLLPIIPEEREEAAESVDFLFEPGVDAILENLIPKYIASQVYRAILETAASEHGARMSAMDSASKNASEMIGKLTIQYNRARQAAITTELMDIINGAQAV